MQKNKLKAAQETPEYWYKIAQEKKKSTYEKYQSMKSAVNDLKGF